MHIPRRALDQHNAPSYTRDSLVHVGHVLRVCNMYLMHAAQYHMSSQQQCVDSGMVTSTDGMACCGCSNTQYVGSEVQPRIHVLLTSRFKPPTVEHI